MIKILCGLLLFGVLASSLMGCSGRNNNRAERLRSWMAPNGKIKILSTIAQIGDLVQEVGGERVDGSILISGDLDPHSYELVKGDDEKLVRADAVFYNGLGLEHGAGIAAALSNNPKNFSVGEYIRRTYPSRILEKTKSVDPHIWMDVSLWKEAVDPIAEKLSALDPAGTDYYKERAEQFKQQMVKTHYQIQETLQKIPPQKRYLVTSHDAFNYFTKSYLASPEEGEDWKERFASPEGLAPDGQLNPVDISSIIEYLKIHRVSVLFPESNVSRDSIKKIVSAGREAGLNISICSEALYGDALGKKGELRYLDTMRQNADTIARHLNEGGERHE